MGVMAKCTSGKRINFGQRGSYFRRAKSAVMAFDHGAFWLPKVFTSTPCLIWKNSEMYYKPKLRVANKTKGKKKGQGQNTQDPLSYGAQADEGKFSQEELEEAVCRLEATLQLSHDVINLLERTTIGQSTNEIWKMERRNRITASNAGRIYTFADWRDNTALLKSLLYPTDLSKIDHIKYGINCEPEARALFSTISGKEVHRCGLFISHTKGFLAASPDGIIDNDGILEVKCTTVPPDQISTRPDNFLIRKTKGDPSSGLMLKRSHKYFYQILMQLYVTGRNYCELFVFHKPKDSSEESSWFRETIHRTSFTDALWVKLEEKLTKFFHNEFAPEIVNPIFHTKKKFHVPDYRSKAADEHLKKNQEKVKKQEQRKLKKTLANNELNDTQVIQSNSQFEVILQENSSENDASQTSQTSRASNSQIPGPSSTQDPICRKKRKLQE
jgi:hypothetical protein